MASDYSLELWDVRGLPSSYNRLVLEVIVRTPRLLSTVRRKHSTSGFQADAARGVTISWSQAKAAKASFRLRVVPGNAAAAADSVTTAAAPSAVSEGLLKACKSREVPLLLGAQGLQAAQLQLQLQTDPGGSGGAAAAAGGGGGGGRADTGCLVAEVEFVVRSKADGGDGNPAAAAAAAPASAAMPAAANNAASNPNSTSTGAGGDSAAAGGSPLATLRSSSLHAWGEQAAAAAQPETAPSAAGTAAATAAPTARKRSWLLALGLVRHAGGGGAGSAEHATDAGGGNCALARCSSERTLRGDGSGMVVAPRARSRTVGGALFPLAASAAASPSTAALGAGPGLLCPSPDGSCEDRPWVGPGGDQHPQPPSQDLQEQQRQRQQQQTRWGGLRTRLPNATSSGGGGVSAQAAAGAPEATAASAAAEVAAGPPAPVPPQPTAAAAAAALAAGRPSQQALPSLPSESPEPQPPKRRRLGDFLARLFGPSSASGHSHSRRGGAVLAAASSDLPHPAATGIAPMSAAGSPSPSAALPAPLPAGSSAVHPHPLHHPSEPQHPTNMRRPASPPGLAPLVPPQPQLGDVYRIPDGNYASEGGVQVGFGATLDGSGSLPQPIVLPGLDSPGAGDTSPAAGPDRLTVEPPVEDMAAASLASPMAASPSPSAAGCLSWWYGSSTRVRAMPPPPAEATVVSLTTADVLDVELSGGAGCGAVQAVHGKCNGLVSAPPAAAANNGGGGGFFDTSSTVPMCIATFSSGAAAQTAAAAMVSRGPGQEQGAAGADAQAAAGAAVPSPLEAEIGRVEAFVNAQKEIADELRASSLSQCQFLLDCLKSSDLCWLVGDSLLQLKLQLGFPFDAGSPMPDAPDWFRLVLQPLQPHMQLAAAAASAPATGGQLQPPSSPPSQQQQQEQEQLLASCSAVTGGGVEIVDKGTATLATASAGAVTHGSGPQPSVTHPPHCCPPEVLKVRWAPIDQRQAGGANACAAIVLEVAAWCLSAVQRWHAASSGASSASAVATAAGVIDLCQSNSIDSEGCSIVGVKELPIGPSVSRTPRRMPPHLPSVVASAAPAVAAAPTAVRAAAAASVSELDAMTGAALEQCIRAGTAVWQGLLAQSEAARVASSTGDFDLEHMLQLGGYSCKLRLAEYAAASLLEGGTGAGGCGLADAAAAAAGCRPSSAEVPAGAAASGGASLGGKDGGSGAQQPPLSLLFPCLPVEGQRQQHPLPPVPPAVPPLALQQHHPSQQPLLSPRAEALGESMETENQRSSLQLQQQQQQQQPALTVGAAVRRSIRRCSSAGGVPAFSSLVSCLDQGVYVLGWRGHFATLWLRPGGRVHLIDSLGARLSADCPLAFVLEFPGRPEFLSFFLSRHRARRDAAAADDIAGGNLAALVEVHRLELRALG